MPFTLWTRDPFAVKPINWYEGVTGSHSRCWQEAFLCWTRRPELETLVLPASETPSLLIKKEKKT